MSTAVIKSIQVAGSTVEVLAVADDGNVYRVQTNGTLASLKSALQQATTKASDLKTKPELSEGMTVDFTPVAATPIEPPSKEEQARIDYFRDRAEWLTQRELAEQPPELASRYLPEYGQLNS